jgi:hypothetical protein
MVLIIVVTRKNNLSGILEKTLGQIREKKKKIKSKQIRKLYFFPEY